MTGGLVTNASRTSCGRVPWRLDEQSLPWKPDSVSVFWNYQDQLRPIREQDQLLDTLMREVEDHVLDRKVRRAAETGNAFVRVQEMFP